jgi:hypothetical protein
LVAVLMAVDCAAALGRSTLSTPFSTVRVSYQGRPAAHQAKHAAVPAEPTTTALPFKPRGDVRDISDRNKLQTGGIMRLVLASQYKEQAEKTIEETNSV